MFGKCDINANAEGKEYVDENDKLALRGCDRNADAMGKNGGVAAGSE